mgnify:CR=1 FL=1
MFSGTTASALLRAPTANDDDDDDDDATQRVPNNDDDCEGLRVAELNCTVNWKLLAIEIN